MLGNYILVALRVAARQKLYALITVGGLAVAFAAALLIGVFIRHELSYEGFFPKADRIWQMVTTYTIPGREPVSYFLGPEHPAPLVAQADPGVAQVARLGVRQATLSVGSDLFREWVYFAEPAFFDMMPLPLASGDLSRVLAEPDLAAVSEEMARKLFGTTDAVDREITLNRETVLRVAAVLRDPPSNTQFDIGIITSMQTRGFALPEWGWGDIHVHTFVELNPGADIEAVRRAMPALIDANAPPFIQSTGDLKGSDWFAVDFVPLTRVHLSGADGHLGRSVSPTTLAVFGLVGLLIVAIAVINFINLTTARGAQRAREVAVRKALGAQPKQLVRQFLGEASAYALAALLVGCAIAELASGWFAAALGTDLSAVSLFDPVFLAGAVLLAVVCGVLGGAYPAFALSALPSALSLKPGGHPLAQGRGLLRSTLVVAQFAIAIGLVVASAVVLQQWSHAKSVRLGYDRENLVILRGLQTPVAREVASVLRDRLAADPGIAAVSLAAAGPLDSYTANNTAEWVGPDGQPSAALFHRLNADTAFFPTLGTRLVAGRFLDDAVAGDTVPLPAPEGQEAPPRHFNILINEQMVTGLGFSSADQALGFTVEMEWGAPVFATIVGVVENYRQYSVRSRIEPTYYYNDGVEANVLVLRLAQGDQSATLARVDALWRELLPDQPISRHFVEDRLNSTYAAEGRTFQLFAAFSGIAIVIACLGLFALAAFTAERRTKEIGVRKVLGAGVPDIILLLVWQFSKPILLANLIAWPAAAYAMDRWLQGYTVRIDLDPLVFVAAGVSALLIAWVTVAGHATWVAMTPPSRALRYE